MRFLICGLGSIGRRHLRNLVALGQKDIVLLRSGNSTLPEDELTGYPAESDLQAALERWNPDAVLVTNPTALHLGVAIPAARGGCHLLIEKPLSHSMERIDQLRLALEQGGGQALMGFQFRYNAGLARIRQLLMEGRLGRPLLAHSHWGEYLPDWHPWEDYRRTYAARRDLGGGVLLTMCHPYDYLRWLLGEVAAVKAQVSLGGPLELEVESAADLIFQQEGEVLTSVHLDWLQRPPSHTLEVICERGTAKWDAASSGARWWSREEGEWREEPPPAGYERNTMFMNEMRHFLEVAAGAAQPSCTLEDGIRALEIALAARRSALRKERLPL